MWPVGSKPSRAGTLITVVTIGAGNSAGGGPGNEQAGHVAILAQALDRVKGTAGRSKLEPGVGLLVLPGNLCRASSTGRTATPKDCSEPASAYQAQQIEDWESWRMRNLS